MPLAHFSPPPGEQVPFEICYFNAGWSIPAPDVQAQHLAADPRYRGMDLGHTAAERVHIELGPFRSASALGDFLALSGLWSDPNATAGACPSDLRGKAELWALELRVQRVELGGSDLTAIAAPAATGIEVVQVSLPPAAEALHVVDPDGQRLSPDVNLRDF